MEEELNYLKASADELALHVEELNEENLTECVYLTLLPNYISTDMSDLVNVTINRSGVVVSATYNGADEARALFDKLVKYLKSVMSLVPDLNFYMLASLGFPDFPEHEELAKIWIQYEATVHKIDESALAGLWSYPNKDGELPKMLLVATIPDETSFVTEDKLSAIIQEQEEQIDPFFKLLNESGKK